MVASLNYSEQRLLLVDSSGNMRATLKDMLGRLGFTQVKTLTMSERVLDVLETEDFDIVLIGHNIHDSYSGLQLLEEARYRELMKPTCSWVLMTSDSSQQALLFALEEEPDEVLIKPFSVEELRQRLDQLSKKRLLLEPIERAIARKAPNRAIQLCDSLFEKSHPYYAQVQLLKAQLMIEQAQYPQAEAILETYYWRDKNLRSGFFLAKCWYQMGKIVQAQTLLENLIKDHPLLVPAYDLLALVHEVQGHLEDAKEILQQGLRRSPLVIQRQMDMGRIFTRTGQLDQAASAYRRSVSLGEHSCQAKPEAYLRLANVQRMQLEGQNEREQQRAAQEIDRLLTKAKRQFPKDPALKVESVMLMSKVYEDLHDEEQAKSLLESAESIAAEYDLVLDLEQTLGALIEVPVPVAPEYQGDDAEKAIPHGDPVMSAKVNRIGVRNYLAGKPGQAIRYFTMAFEQDKGNPAALLNLAQLFLEAARDNPERSNERLKMFDRYLRLAERLPLDPEAEQKLQQLKLFRGGETTNLPVGALSNLLK